MNNNNTPANDYVIQKAGKSGLFRNYIFKAIPLAFDESLSYYECLCGILNYLKNTVIPVLNNNADVIAQLQNNINTFETNVNQDIANFKQTTNESIAIFEQSVNQTVQQLQDFVNNYFANLDVQEEINNKLDKMVIDGVFDNILINYTKIEKIYLTHTDLIADTSLVNGMKVRTLGYHSVNDGGGAHYVVNNVSGASYYNEQIGESILYLRLIDSVVYPEMFGAYGDGTHNDTTAFTTLINYYDTVNLYEKTYKLTSLTITKDLVINGNNATLIDDTSVTNFIQMTENTENKVLRIFNLNIDTPNSDVGIYIQKNKMFAEYLHVKHAITKNIHVVKVGSSGLIEVNNIKCEYSPIGIHIQASDCHISNYVGHNCIVHLKNNGGITHVNGFHGWNFNEGNTDYITGSTLIDTTSSINGSDLYVDTLENGIKLPANDQYVSIILQNVAYFINRSSYPTTQQHPTILKDYTTFTGWLRIDGLYMNDNGWKDSNNVYPTLIPDLNLNKVSITNVTNSGFQLGRFKPYQYTNDVQTSSYTVDLDTYVNIPDRKLKAINYDLHCYIRGTMKTSCADGTEMLTVTFTGQGLENTNLRTEVSAKFIESDNTDNTMYNLKAYIDDNHVLHVINNSGVNLGAQNHYGRLHIYIDDYNLDF